MSNLLTEMDPGIMHEHLLMLMDSSFTEFRDYYLRKGMFQTDLRYFKKDQNNEYLKKHLNNPDITQIQNKTSLEYAKMFASICNQTKNRDFTTKLRNEIEHLKLDNIFTPYEKVGQILKFIEDQKNNGIRIWNHEYLRSTMEHMLLSLICIELKNKPNTPVFEQGIDTSLIGILNKVTKDDIYTWKALWSADPEYHTGDRWGASKSSPNNRFIDKAKRKHELRTDFKYGEHLLTSKLFRHGYMYNRLSSARIQEFIERQYILTATNETFDKTFFQEWLSGYNWSSLKNKQKFEMLKSECITKWIEMISKLVIAELELIFPIAITTDIYKDDNDNEIGTSRSVSELIELGIAPLPDTSNSIAIIDDFDEFDLKSSSIELKNRLPTYIDLDKKLRIESIKNNPILYLYKDLMMMLPEIDVEKVLIEKYPNIKKLDILTSDFGIQLSSIEQREKHLCLINYLLAEQTPYDKDTENMEFI